MPYTPLYVTCLTSKFQPCAGGAVPTAPAPLAAGMEQKIQSHRTLKDTNIFHSLYISRPCTSLFIACLTSKFEPFGCQPDRTGSLSRLNGTNDPIS